MSNKNHSRGGSSRTIRPDRDNNQKSTPNPGPKGASGSDRRSRSKFEHIPSISRSSGLERDGDTYVHMRLLYVFKDPVMRQLQTERSWRSRGIPKVLATEGTVMH